MRQSLGKGKGMARVGWPIQCIAMAINVALLHYRHSYEYIYMYMMYMMYMMHMMYMIYVCMYVCMYEENLNKTVLGERDGHQCGPLAL